MELEELSRRLPAFCRATYGHVRHGGTTDSWFLRLPPPNVNWRGTADVLRQVAVLDALDDTDVPHCSVQWSGDDLQWFDRPYFVVPWLEGDVLRLGEGEWGTALSDAQLHELGRQAMTALAGVHRVDPAQATYLGDAMPFEEDVTRWDRFYERAAEPERLKLAPVVRSRLLERLPADAPVGIFHGDFQTANLFCSTDGNLKAVIDWELTGIGATLNDVGWIVTFSDPEAWPKGDGARSMFLDPETLVGLYREAWGGALPDLDWFRALAAYKFAIISGFNLSLHRRGKRHDPVWETTALAMEPLMARARELLG